MSQAIKKKSFRMTAKPKRKSKIIINLFFTKQLESQLFYSFDIKRERERERERIWQIFRNFRKEICLN